ncbi:InlB B-repeat-containing protein [Anaerostipes sp.]|uniref:InlB B-repeat-containing protein n=1 Tax=Anaerostipes sp. TaxID=1872530 RepID=UPI0025BDB4FB|nr:InlB B-repeat-containing protein [Anaerostipes sp.]
MNPDKEKQYIGQKIKQSDSEKKPQTKSATSKKKTSEKTETGQTKLDVSKGSIQIKTGGAVGGGLTQPEDNLNPEGYYITGTTTTNKIVVDPGVTTDITFDNLSITNQNREENCVTVSHADVSITLIGENKLLCEETNYGGLVKEGMDETVLTLKCEYAGEKGHKCREDICGSLEAGGKASHVTAIGSITATRHISSESGFSNLYIKGGIIKAFAGDDNCAIGAACCSWGLGKGYTKNIHISGGIVTAIGSTYCAGIGSGCWTPTDGIYITGGTVYAKGGTDSPGIGSGGNDTGIDTNKNKGVLDVSNVVISGGDTIVKALGDIDTNMPGIGCGKTSIGGEKGITKNVTASPDDGYQGYIQDGTTETDYDFTDDTPFSTDTAISVEKYYTKIYFGPYRDENTIAKDTKEQIGANHVVSKTGGTGFTESQLKDLTKVTGKQENGSNFSAEELTFTDTSQIEKINKAKTGGKIGDYPLTFTTPDGTEVTVTVSLRDSGTDASNFDPENPTPVIGANDFEKDTGGDAFTEEQLKKYGEVKGKDKEGNTISLEDFTIDAEQFKKINEAKTSGKTGVFDLTYLAADGNLVKVKVSLVKYDETVKNPESEESIKGMNVISKTGGEGFSEAQLKNLTKVQAFDENGHEIPAADLVLSDPDELEAINKAKTAGETGDFSLSFETAGKTKVTVTVFLRDQGTDGAEENPEKPAASIAANDAVHKTGGNAFSKEDLIGLCKVKGKDEAKNNVQISIKTDEMDRLNTAKKAGKTGAFSLTFSVSEGIEAKVTVTLTGEHKVSFNPNGGDFTPKTQTVTGGNCAVEPKEPGREGYTFEGWYYKDENGKEQKWDFGTPVHSDISLKARWTKEPEGNTSSEKKDSTDGNKNRKDKTKKKNESYYWDSEDITKDYGNNGSVAKTGDTKSMAAVIFMMIAGGGVLCLLYYKINRNRKNYK